MSESTRDSELSYLAEKVRNAEILEEPFVHLEIRDFLRADHLGAVLSDSQISGAVHKNLTGYQISPHPDRRHKCMTLLLTLNQDDSVAEYGCYTHLLRFKKEYEYIYDFWDRHEEIERNWVPWEWCETRKTIQTNNTMLVFPPSNRSLHAVRLDYPHTKSQRTVLRGTIHYTERAQRPYLPNKYKDLEKLRPGEGRLMGAARLWSLMRRRQG